MKLLTEYLSTKVKASIERATDDTIGEMVLDGLVKYGPEADLNYIDTYDVTSFKGLFAQTFGSYVFAHIKEKEPNCKIHKINPDVSRWETKNAKSMLGMFYNCKCFDCDVSGWDVSNVKNFRNMFKDCKTFNQDLSGWNLESAEDVLGMFNTCERLNCDLSGWELKKVKLLYDNIGEMFDYTGMPAEKLPPKYIKFYEAYFGKTYKPYF